MEEQGAAVHFDGAGQQAAEVVDVPEDGEAGEWCVREQQREKLQEIQRQSPTPVLRGLYRRGDFVLTELSHCQRGERLVRSVGTNMD